MTTLWKMNIDMIEKAQRKETEIRPYVLKI